MIFRLVSLFFLIEFPFTDMLVLIHIPHLNNQSIFHEVIPHSYHFKGWWAFFVTWKIRIVSCRQIFKKRVNAFYKVRPFSTLWKANYFHIWSSVVILQIVNFLKEIKYFPLMLFFILLKAWNTIFWIANPFHYSSCSNVYFIYQILLCPLNLPFHWTCVETSLHKGKRRAFCASNCTDLQWWQNNLLSDYVQ